MISVGGWVWSGEFSNVCASKEARDKFAKSAVEFIVEWGFDGIDLDWEYPQGGGLEGNSARPEDKVNFTLLMANLRERLNAQGKLDGKTYLLSFASTGNRPQLKQYEFVKLAEIVDWINIMSYDQHVPNHSEWNAVTGLNSSLYSNPNEPEIEEVVKHFNVAFICQEMVRLGVPKAKLNAGFPFYGKGYSDVPAINNGLFQEYKGISS